MSIARRAGRRLQVEWSLASADLAGMEPVVVALGLPVLVSVHHEWLLLGDCLFQHGVAVHRTVLSSPVRS